MREELETRIQELTKFHTKSQALAPHERHLREEVERTPRNIPANWKKTQEELRNIIAYNHHFKEACKASKSEGT